MDNFLNELYCIVFINKKPKAQRLQPKPRWVKHIGSDLPV